MLLVNVILYCLRSFSMIVKRWNGGKDYRTRITGLTGSAGYLKVKWRKEGHETSPPSYILCHPGQACLTRDPVF